jgi:hypothetical protein
VTTANELEQRLEKLEDRVDGLLRLFGVVDEEEEPPPPETEFSYEAGLAADEDVYRVTVHGPIDDATHVVMRQDGHDDEDLVDEPERVKGELLRAQIALADLDAGVWTTFVLHPGEDDEPIDTFQVVDEPVPPELLS